MTLRAIIVSFFLGATALLAQGNPDWHREFPAFRIAGNIYYVGTADLASYLIATPQGHILLNTDFKEDVPLIKKSVEQLGFAYKDIKIILISHAHGDHDAATGLEHMWTASCMMATRSSSAALS